MWVANYYINYMAGTGGTGQTIITTDIVRGKVVSNVVVQGRIVKDIIIKGQTKCR